MYLKGKKKKHSEQFRNKQKKIFSKTSKLKHGSAGSNGLLGPGWPGPRSNPTSCGRRNYIGIYIVESIPANDKNILSASDFVIVPVNTKTMKHFH